MTHPVAACLLAAGLAAAATGPAAAIGQTIHYFPAIDCSRDYGASIDAICRSDGLRFLDDRIAQRYSEAYARAGWPGQRRLHADQQRFIAARNVCGSDTGCLWAVHRRRVQTVGVISWS